MTELKVKMSEKKEFQRTMRSAEKSIKDGLEATKLGNAKSQIHNSCTHLEISLEKFLENTTVDELQLNREHIDNIYYHLGAIKGCL